ncbi:cell envelope integrity protein CreD [Cupriavidus agavae]|uniref:Inner membrane protein n=1 Tax=Cupriavidus agavae TaxID=1001822 RepID=A0A4Q7S8G3_9BURK|nr:cell envelope integrity protein CreD [Cupriavidus agavae]RZT42040.1 inner membrane protein [Cupriavidus agavae]
MNKPLIFRILMIGGVVVLLWIALQMIFGIVRERGIYRDDAERSIWQSYAGPQTLTGPIIVLPYKEIIADPPAVDRTAAQPKFTPATTYREETRQILIFPKNLQVHTGVTPSERYRGIHKAIVYETTSDLSGTIELPDVKSTADLRKSTNHVRFEVEQPYVVVGVGDMRGLVSVPVIQIGGAAVKLAQGTRLGSLLQGLHGRIDASAAVGKPAEARVVPFSMKLAVLGARTMSITPVADLNQFSMQSPWPHPSFDGEFLPRQRSVSAEGFKADWSITSFNTRVREQLARPQYAGLEGASVTLMEPINIYVQAERAVKYGLLFVLLTFAGLYLFELVKTLRIHPIQYLLAGLALAMFFLLLVSLSEHVAFLVAYLAASAACIGLLGFYLTFVLRSWQRGLGFAALLTVLYGALYGLLVSEDNALVLGTGLLFVTLVIIMGVTRKVDWYTVGMSTPAPVQRTGEESA